jgi:hypothetical protein
MHSQHALLEQTMAVRLSGVAADQMPTRLWSLSRPLQQSTEPLTCSSLVSHVGTARRDLFDIRIVIKDGLRLQLVAGQSIQSGLLLLLGVGDHQHSRGASQANAG